MNIREAKEELRHTVQAYLKKDEQGNYRLPVLHQRPVLFIGPPGIGKTAIVEQIAREEGLGLVAYTMTHHTRQSAVGLPVLVKKQYQGKECTVTEYTMSEIIASVYACIEVTGYREGILFIDEINCVSETLTPTMLQFLQNKTFGTHKVPAGWVIVAAGNPQEYNKSAREFDIVTLDRVRKMEIQEDFQVWEEYACAKGIHHAVLSWLRLHPDCFYHVDNRTNPPSFVTARGWEELSLLLGMYEEMGILAQEHVIAEYLQDEQIARDFGAYYRLYQRYRQEYDISGILDGTLPAQMRRQMAELARGAAADERLALVGMILDGWKHALGQYEHLKEQRDYEKKALQQWENSQDSLLPWIQKQREALSVRQEAHVLTPKEAALESQTLKVLEQKAWKLKEQRCRDREEVINALRHMEEELQSHLLQTASCTKLALERGFAFAQEALGDGLELAVLTADLMQNPSAAFFISTYGCEGYFAHEETLLLERRRKKILRELDVLFPEPEKLSEGLKG